MSLQRDPLGLQPLYYALIDGAWHFEEDIDILLSHFSSPKRPNIRSMRNLLYGSAVDYHETMYEGIYRVPPGHRLVAEGATPKYERYWFPENIAIDATITEAEAARRIRELLERAVTRMADDPDKTAFEVSGGLDSSAVTAIAAQRFGSDRIDSYSMDFGDYACDEGPYVDALVSRYRTRHHKVPSWGLDYHRTYTMAYLYTLSPHWPITLTFAMMLPMYEQMRKEGKKVVLTGQGGDHLFTGTPYVLHDLLKRGAFGRFYRELQSYGNKSKALKSYVVAPMIGKKGRMTLRRVFGRSVADDGCKIDGGDILDLTDKLGIFDPANKAILDALTSAHFSTVMDSNILRCVEDHFGLEFRHPFFDMDLVAFVLSLPPEMKYRNRTIKYIFREAMQDILPEKIRYRRDKAEFSQIIAEQIDSIEIERLLHDAYLAELGIVGQQTIRTCISNYRRGDYGTLSFFWTMLNLEYWYRLHFGEGERRLR